MSEAKTKVLVVDDDLRLRDLLNRYLGEQGFVVKSVSDAAGIATSAVYVSYDPFSASAVPKETTASASAASCPPRSQRADLNSISSMSTASSTGCSTEMVCGQGKTISIIGNCHRQAQA